MAHPERHYRLSLWLRAFLVLLCGANVFGAYVIIQQQGSRDPVALTVASVAVLLVLGTLDALTKKVSLEGEEIVIVRGFRRRRLFRGHIADVHWKAGHAISLELDDGLRVKLPEVGKGRRRAEQIRAWLAHDPLEG